MGEKAGGVNIRKIGSNSGVSTAEVDIRSEDANLAYQTVAKALEILSGDTDDDGKSTGTLTLVSAVAVTPATGTVTCASVEAADTVTVNGLVYTAVAGAKADNTEFSIDTGDDECAADLADSITNDTRSGTLNDVTAVSSTDTVTITQTVPGAAGNATTLVSSNGTRLAVSGGTFTGGLDADVATVNGLTYTGVAGAKANNTEFSVDTSDTAAAADLADSINNDTRTPLTVPTANVVATSALGVVTINQDGEIGDLVDIAGTTNITASDSTLTDVGTGARSVVIEGLDVNYQEITETVFLNGTTVVACVNTYLRVNRAYVDQVGSAGVNAGLITIRLASAGAVQIVIPIGDGESQITNHTVPAGSEALMKKLNITISQAGGNAVVVLIKGKYRLVGKSWRTFYLRYGTGDHAKEFQNDELTFPPKTDIRFTAIKQNGTDDAEIGVDYTLRQQAG